MILGKAKLQVTPEEALAFTHRTALLPLVVPGTWCPSIAVTAGPLTLCNASDNRGGAWAEDGTIIFSPDRAGTSLWTVSAAGGPPTSLTSLDAGEVTQRWPQVLPRRKGILYTSHNNPNGFDDANVVVQPLPRGARKVLVRGAYDGRYIPIGHLIYAHD